MYIYFQIFKTSGMKALKHSLEIITWILFSSCTTVKNDSQASLFESDKTNFSIQHRLKDMIFACLFSKYVNPFVIALSIVFSIIIGSIFLLALGVVLLFRWFVHKMKGTEENK